MAQTVEILLSERKIAFLLHSPYWLSQSRRSRVISSDGIEAQSQIAKSMRPTWDPPGSCRPQMGHMLAPWALLSGVSNLTSDIKHLVLIIPDTWNINIHMDRILWAAILYIKYNRYLVWVDTLCITLTFQNNSISSCLNRPLAWWILNASAYNFRLV